MPGWGRSQAAQYGADNDRTLTRAGLPRTTCGPLLRLLSGGYRPTTSFCVAECPSDSSRTT